MYKNVQECTIIGYSCTKKGNNCARMGYSCTRIGYKCTRMYKNVHFFGVFYILLHLLLIFYVFFHAHTHAHTRTHTCESVNLHLLRINDVYKKRKPTKRKNSMPISCTIFVMWWKRSEAFNFFCCYNLITFSLHIFWWNYLFVTRSLLNIPFRAKR